MSSVQPRQRPSPSSVLSGCAEWLCQCPLLVPSQVGTLGHRRVGWGRISEFTSGCARAGPGCHRCQESPESACWYRARVGWSQRQCDSLGLASSAQRGVLELVPMVCQVAPVHWWRSPAWYRHTATGQNGEPLAVPQAEWTPGRDVERGAGLWTRTVLSSNL